MHQIIVIHIIIIHQSNEENKYNTIGNSRNCIFSRKILKKISASCFDNNFLFFLFIDIKDFKWKLRKLKWELQSPSNHNFTSDNEVNFVYSFLGITNLFLFTLEKIEFKGLYPLFSLPKKIFKKMYQTCINNSVCSPFFE